MSPHQSAAAPPPAEPVAACAVPPPFFFMIKTNCKHLYSFLGPYINSCIAACAVPPPCPAPPPPHKRHPSSSGRLALTPATAVPPSCSAPRRSLLLALLYPAAVPCPPAPTPSSPPPLRRPCGRPDARPPGSRGPARRRAPARQAAAPRPSRVPCRPSTHRRAAARRTGHVLPKPVLRAGCTCPKMTRAGTWTRAGSARRSSCVRAHDTLLRAGGSAPHSAGAGTRRGRA